jgi:hypothetical protein
MSNSDCLRKHYRDNASLFLYLTNELADPNQESQVHSRKRQMFNPLSTSKSLVLRSRYEDAFKGHADGKMMKSRCILQREVDSSLDAVNLIRSGGKPVTMDFETCQNAIKSISSANESLVECIRSQSENKTGISERIQNLSKFLSNGVVSPASSDSQQNCVNDDFCCSCCGSHLLPVHPSDNIGSRIRIKSLSRSLSMRRRASRYLAKRHNFEGNIIQKQRGGGRTFSNASNSHGAAVSNVMDTLTALKKNHAQHRVYDGLAKNVIIYKCNSCSHEKLIKGAPYCAKVQEGKGNAESKETEKHQLPNKGGSYQLPLQQEKDFLSFSASVETPTRCLLSKPKKKKKKVETQKKSGLQNFLSSLND